MSEGMINRPVTIRCGKLTVPAGNPEQGPPGSGGVITIYDSALDWNGQQPQATGLPFTRVVLTLFSSHDSAASGLVFANKLDGVIADTVVSYTYSAAGGEFTYDYLIRSGSNVLITYTNSANVLTAWRYRLIGVIGDRNPGA